ncbi:hypothetical protein NE236_00125 [Actinoallomurus purpureus]|uniref:DUF6406 domain-containing protein n=1 Tax=Actinoallomurus purpureus TaxID=478114 RepID=UPI002091FE99|nr:DUF6406 domain-containing protein [Actinoallomurus purpureus]MCO6003383.1 hypothetical protein [Actinoallomurus purpureus]
MTDYLPGTIDLYGGIPRRLGGGEFIAGDSYLDDQDRLEVSLTVDDDAGERDIKCHEGDVFDFAGATWRVTTIFEVSMSARRRIATLSKDQ